jgi:hypothetical protein
MEIGTIRNETCLKKEEQEKENKQRKKYCVKYLKHNGKIINKNES